jgi:hypothetical protein
MKFVACLPPDAQSPLKPTKDGTPQMRRYRLWLDAYLLPGQAEEILNHEGNFVVTLDPEQK